MGKQRALWVTAHFPEKDGMRRCNICDAAFEKTTGNSSLAYHLHRTHPDLARQLGLERNTQKQGAAAAAAAVARVPSSDDGDIAEMELDGTSVSASSSAAVGNSKKRALSLVSSSSSALRGRVRSCRRIRFPSPLALDARRGDARYSRELHR